MTSKINGAKLIEFLNQKWSGRPCPQCHVANWQVQDSAYQLMQFSGGGIVIGGPVLPVVPVICGNCGNTILVNALMLGAIGQPDVNAIAQGIPSQANQS
jgi:hypothetical protein